jgi:hypothetical protein
MHQHKTTQLEVCINGLRNLAIQNGNHVDLPQAIAIIKTAIKDKTNESSHPK